MSFNIYPDWTKRNGIYPQWLGPDAEPVPAEEPQKLYGGGGTGFQKVQDPDSGRIDHEKRKQRRRNMAIIEFVTQFTTEYL